MKIIIIGGRGTSIVVAEQMYDANQRYGMDIEVIGLALDDRSGGDEIFGYPILCDIKDVYEKYKKYEDVKFVYMLYRPDVIKERTEILYNLNIPITKFATFIHPSSLICKSVKLGYGNIILSNVVLNSNVVIGNFNTFNSGILVEHDTKIGNNNFLAGHVCIGSGLEIGSMNFLGLNSTVRNGITIGDCNIFGMSSNIVKNVSDNNILYGNPAKIKPKLNHVIR